MTSRERLGGIIHTYQKYNPVEWPSPNRPPPDLVSPVFDHLLAHGDLRELTDEELARAVRIDPSMISGLGPSLAALRELLEERKRKLLATYETHSVQRDAQGQYARRSKGLEPPPQIQQPLEKAIRQEQLRELERLWNRAGNDRSKFSRQLLKVISALGDKYQVDELAGKYAFTGQTRLSIPQALELKDELETIDRLLNQLNEAQQNAQIGIIDLEELARYVDEAGLEQLRGLEQQVRDLLRSMAERQGLESSGRGYQLTPQAYRLFQGKLLEEIFSELEASRTGRHVGPVEGEGAVELQATKPYEFGDALSELDIPSSLMNALLRQGPGLPIRMTTDDMVVRRTRNLPKCATAVVMDMSGSMRYGGLYVNVKRMALALDGLIRREYPGDFLQFVEVYSLAKLRRPNEIVGLMPKIPTIFDPYVQLKADLSDPEISELQIPPHFTNLQHGLRMARQVLSAQDTPNRQIILITDGLPTAHFEGHWLYLLYPPHPRTEQATMREGLLCHREGITINIFLLSTWNQTSEDVQFAYRLAQSTSGRVFFTGGRELDRFVVWDYVGRRRKIIG